MSEIRANTVSNAAGTGPVTLTGQYAAKAWVNFNGTGTVAIRQSGNVGSITDNGTGNYTCNFTISMADVNYTLVGSGSNRIPNLGDAGSCVIVDPNNGYSAGSVRIATKNVEGTSSGQGIDLATVSIAIFR